MNYNQFSNLSCYEEFEIQSALTGISKIDVLKEIGHKIDDYYFFVSDDGIFNWFDLEGNHIKDPGILKELKAKHIPSSISKCIIPNSVTRINEYAFSNCKSLKEIAIPNSVTYIGRYAFYNCISLTSITIPNNVKNIGGWAFQYCRSLKEITIPNSVKSIDNGAFSCCESLKEITITNNVTSIGAYAFSYCNSSKEVIFKGKTLEEVKRMENYPFGIADESIFKIN